MQRLEDLEMFEYVDQAAWECMLYSRVCDSSSKSPVNCFADHYSIAKGN